MRAAARHSGKTADRHETPGLTIFHVHREIGLNHLTQCRLKPRAESRLRCVGLELAKWALACGLLLLVPSPVDIVPDVVPGLGFADDVGYLIAAIAAARSAWGERNKRKLYEEVELHELRRRAESEDISRN
ncbi:MAG: DUF1232 domain-containing protein [Phycisphaerae bacterium]|nr:DUF1232 domain-containing protein [Phycisphaerae bacterium]NUQ46557.1 DUF1232 domain-containing protein [Phycisphaerae bacterium]